MTPGPTMRRAMRVIAVVLLLGLAWTGVSGGISQWSESHTPWQQAQTTCQLAYGLLALLAIATTFRGRRWNRVALGGWGASLTLAAVLASVVWGGTTWAVGLLAGGVTLLVALVIAWLLLQGSWS